MDDDDPFVVQTDREENEEEGMEAEKKVLSDVDLDDIDIDDEVDPLHGYGLTQKTGSQSEEIPANDDFQDDLEEVHESIRMIFPTYLNDRRRSSVLKRRNDSLQPEDPEEEEEPRKRARRDFLDLDRMATDRQKKRDEKLLRKARSASAAVTSYAQVSDAMESISSMLGQDLSSNSTGLGHRRRHTFGGEHLSTTYTSCNT